MTMSDCHTHAVVAWPTRRCGSSVLSKSASDGMAASARTIRISSNFLKQSFFLKGFEYSISRVPE
jgi:hypothetical protein